MVTSLVARRLSAICALSLLGACALPAAPAQRPSRYRADVPLVARLQSTGPQSASGLRFYLNRPAHVALFEVVPGRGIGLLYPSSGFGSQHLSGGTHLASTQNAFFRGGYLPRLGASTALEPRYVLLVASERPLRLDEIQRSPYGLRSIIGLQNFASWNPYAAMESVMQRVLPAGVGDDWTTDVFVEWPDAPPRATTQLVRVQCPSGRFITVPFDQVLLAHAACGDVSQAKFIPPAPSPNDTAEVRPPRRSRPVPEEGASEPGPSRGRQSAPGASEPREPRVARPRPESSEPRSRGSAPREAPARREEPRAEPRPAPRAEPRPEPRAEPRVEPRAEPRVEPRAEPRVEPSQTRVERPTPREQR